jgi:hypothetical protein
MYCARRTEKITGPSGQTTYSARYSRLLGLLVFVMAWLATISPADAGATESAEILAVAPPALTFARYLAFLDRRDVFTESGPVSVEISASLSRKATQAYFAAIRETGASERSEYHVLRLEGDSALTQGVIRPLPVGSSSS